MATYNTLKRGSTGADVKKLQQSLIDKGYDLGKTGADGKYGAITEAAVKQYQKDNKLTVDGMAGKQTQGALYTVAKPTTPTADKNNTVLSNPTEPIQKETYSGDTSPKISVGGPVADAPVAYDPAVDEAYQSALATLMQVQETAPVYKDSYSSQIQDIYDKIVNREKFSYDVNADAMYQQYKDQYIAQGKLAMADTMGQAAAMNGGYGSSYAQSVGQQAYQGYMQQLNDVVPELYDRALAQYNQEGQDMLNQYAMLGDMADDEYAKYQNELNDYYTRLSMAREDVDKAYDRGYGAYRDSVGDSQWEKNYAETVKQNEISNNQWQQSFDENVKQNEISNDQWEQRFEYDKDQDKITNDRYDDQISYERDQAAKNEAYNKVLGFIGTDYTPSDSELSKAGLTREQYDAMSKYATTSGGSTTLDNVASMSSAEIVEAMKGFSELEEDNTALESFLDDCVATGRMTEAQADEYYRKYGKGLILTAPNTTTGVSGNKGGGKKQGEFFPNILQVK